MVGKALYEGILVNMSFAPCFLLSLQVSGCWLAVQGRVAGVRYASGISLSKEEGGARCGRSGICAPHASE